MIADKIEKYLESKDKLLNLESIDNSYLKFKNSIINHFMKDHETRSGGMYTTLYTKPCSRQSAYGYYGFDGESLNARTKINFFTGDIIEFTVLMLAELSGVAISKNNEYLYVSRDNLKITCKPDGLFENKFDNSLYNIEIKKMSDFSYNDFVKKGLSDDWGYQTQASMECEAWKQSKKDVKGTLFIAIKGLTGNIFERFIEYDSTLVDKLFDRVKKVTNSTKENLPERFYSPIEEISHKKKTGRQKLDVFCSYCKYHQICYPDFKLEITKSNTPVWVKNEISKLNEVNK